jgi:hypothetical protein
MTTTSIVDRTARNDYKEKKGISARRTRPDEKNGTSSSWREKLSNEKQKGGA